MNNPTRRAVLAAAAAALGTACGRRKGTGYPGYALIAAAGERAVAVVDLIRFRHVDDIKLNAEPKALIAGPEGIVYVLTPQTGSIHRLTPDLRLKASHRWADTLAGASLSSSGKQLLAISADDREFLIADTRTMHVKSRCRVDAEPKYLTVGAPDYAAISTGAGGTIELFHLGSGQRWRRQMPGEMGKLVFRADGQLLLAANLHDRSLTALSIPALEIIAELPLAMRPDNLCFGADGGQ